MTKSRCLITFVIALACAVFAEPDSTRTVVQPAAVAVQTATVPAADTTAHSTALTAADSTAQPATDTVAKPNPYDLPDELMPLWNSMSIKQKVAQMVMVYLTTADFLAENEIGAILVMKGHLKDTASFKRKISEANEKLNIPLLVASDQEGGKVNRLGGISETWKHAPSAKEMRLMPTDSVEQIAQSIGTELAQLGINLNLAPVLDPAYDSRGKKSFMEESHRSWAFDSTSEDKVRAFVRGMKKAGISCVSKHFPGYDSWTNSDHQIAVSSTPKKKMSENYKFFLNLANDIPVTMMSSVRFVRVSSRPAVFEPKIIRMARKMGKDIVILTDDLWGVSLRAWISGKERVEHKNYPRKDFQKLVVTALNAGNDMFMITYPAKAVEMISYLEKLSKKNSKIKERIEESCARILKMKFREGILKVENPQP
ncbi:glycoside hydrolase family 3 N-terminal domain-containing protein [Fibrobacter sp.]|uniref:glycoside hydrolase family 3 N-terminal domain-containing protein n=1 Tax=Fibrobacter sp. TaxID=35828 RepID=UPI0038905685